MKMKADWQADLPTAGVTAAALYRAQSLTKALRGLDAVFSVRLLHLGECAFDSRFADGLPAGLDGGWFARDVLLCLDDVPVVWARSLCHASAAQWRALLDCGTRPLGERLFDGSLPLSRSPFEYAELDAAEDAVWTGKVWARRSFFVLHGEVLGLAECFLPALADFLPAVHSEE